MGRGRTRALVALKRTRTWHVGDISADPGKIQDRIEAKYPKHRKQSRTRPALLQKILHGTLFGGPVPAHSGDMSKSVCTEASYGYLFEQTRAIQAPCAFPPAVHCFNTSVSYALKKTMCAFEVLNSYELNSCPTCWPSIQRAHRKGEWGTERRRARAWIYVVAAGPDSTTER